MYKSLPMLFVLTITVLGNNAFADVPGFVNINAVLTSMTGQFNVETNPAPGQAGSHIWGNGNANNVVGFGGFDVANNRNFLCYVQVASVLYPAAVDIRNNLGPMAYLRVRKDPNSTACTSLFILKRSRASE